MNENKSDLIKEITKELSNVTLNKFLDAKRKINNSNVLTRNEMMDAEYSVMMSLVHNIILTYVRNAIREDMQGSFIEETMKELESNLAENLIKIQKGEIKPYKEDEKLSTFEA